MIALKQKMKAVLTLFVLAVLTLSCNETSDLWEDDALETSADLEVMLKGKENHDVLTDVRVNVFAKPKGSSDFALIYSGTTDEKGRFEVKDLQVPNIVRLEMADTKYPSGDPVIAKILGQKSASMELQVNTLWHPQSIMDRTGWEVLDFSSMHVTSNTTANLPGNVLLDNTSIWHTNYAGGATPYPHWLVIDMKEVKPMHGFALKQRASNNGPIKGIEFYVSDDNQSWQKVVTTEIPLTNPGEWHTIKLQEPTRGRYIKFVATTPHIPTAQFINLEQLGVY
ncbi:discoidin domain-containing protein [Pontibacter sp. 13R65]|uniref:discoidin domain-containing protein n=1 Tax=Pontibacter sp. 13R65 TaxID=3127458 RepID=UPI00301DA254